MSNYTGCVLSIQILLLYRARTSHTGKISYDKLRPQGGRTTANFSIGSRIVIGIGSSISCSPKGGPRIGIGSRIGIAIISKIEIVMWIGVGIGN